MKSPQEILDTFGFYVIASEWSDGTEIGSVVSRSEIASNILADDAKLVIVAQASEQEWARQCEMMTGRIPYKRQFYWKTVAE